LLTTLVRTITFTVGETLKSPEYTCSGTAHGDDQYEPGHVADELEAEPNFI
jgi:hypothetical protein